MKRYHIIFLPSFLLAVFTGSCVGGTVCDPSGGSETVTVSWAASRSFDVTNVAGGGHKIYYSSSPGVTKNAPFVVDVPLSDSPTSGVIQGLQSGCKIYVRVAGYSALNPAGGDLSVENSIIP